MSRVAGRRWAGLLAVTLTLMALTATTQAPASAAEAPAASVRSAVGATKAAQRLHFTSAVTLGASTVDATGQTDLKANRTSVEVGVGGIRSEFRRIGSTYYVDAKRLGSPAQQWVSLDASKPTGQLATRSVVTLVASFSPQGLLDALAKTTTAIRVGQDVYGTHYSARATISPVAVLPMLELVAPLKNIVATPTPLEVWVDSRGKVARIESAGSGYSTVISLSDYGASVDVAVPPRASTGGLTSASGRFLFGAGLIPKPISGAGAPPTASPTVEFVDGVIRGDFNASSTTGQELRFELTSASHGGKLSVNGQEFALLPYAVWMEGQAKGEELFDVRAREVTQADRYLAGIPLIGLFTGAVISLLQDTPQVGKQLAPIIGASSLVVLPVNVGELAPGNTPIAFTQRVSGYGGTPISINFFPAVGLAGGDTAPVVLQGAGLGEPGNTDPDQTIVPESFAPGTGALRAEGFNVITWDPRGEFASGGVLQLDNPFYEGRDVSSIITWAAENPSVLLNGFGDPAVGMVGGSYGGGIQLVSAGEDPRIDAIVPATTWNSLVQSLQPNGRLNVAAVSQLLEEISNPEIRINPAILRNLVNGIATGELSEEAVPQLTVMDTDVFLHQLQAPTLLLQSTVDALFPLSQSLDSAQTILSNPYGTPVKIGWFDGRAATDVAQQTVSTYAVAWLKKYVSGLPIPDAFTPTFQWWDQVGERYTSDLYPFDPGFNQPDPLVATSKGGSLTLTSTPVKSETTIAMPVKVVAGQQIVGAPVLTFTYRGTGSAQAVYVAVTDSASKAFRPLPTLVPVTLDGKTRTVSVPLNDIAYTGQPDSALTVTLHGYSRGMTVKESGKVMISDIEVALPVRA